MHRVGSATPLRWSRFCHSLDKPRPASLLQCPPLTNDFLLPSKLLCIWEGKPPYPLSYPRHPVPALGGCFSLPPLPHRCTAHALVTYLMALYLTCDGNLSPQTRQGAQAAPRPSEHTRLWPSLHGAAAILLPAPGSPTRAWTLNPGCQLFSLQL